MERIISQLRWLFKLVKSPRKIYLRYISRASADELRSVLACLDYCKNIGSVPDIKSLRNPGRRITRERAVQVFSQHHKKIRQIVVLVLLSIIRSAINDVLGADI